MSKATALERAALITWGTYGPGAMEAFEKEGTPLPPVQHIKLRDLDTDHLEKILAHLEDSEVTTDLMEVAVALVLENRTINNNRREAIRSQKERSRNG
ncbi:MAG: hypothetical protein DRH08_12390 [Deltaproteobacteria bacterium]|nr:MAG: hypothetical protein DRH08_12390 [Deltaproteobacteria bacterium]